MRTEEGNRRAGRGVGEAEDSEEEEGGRDGGGKKKRRRGRRKGRELREVGLV